MKLLVLSIDAMFSEDVDKLYKYPKIAPFLKRALISKDMAPIYPALTYPCHVSIVSGNTIFFLFFLALSLITSINATTILLSW